MNNLCKYITRQHLTCLFLFCLLSGFISCSTKKNTFISRNYHNLTSYYNGYFNAREKVKEGAESLAKSHEDKYDRILSVFQYGNAAKAKAVFPQMDEAIKKTSLVIQRHSMMINGKEYCKWIDENYLLIGIAQFYKYDHFTAEETFQYVATQYKDDPIMYSAMLWLFQTHIALGNQLDAENIIDFIRNDKKFPKKLRKDFYAICADFYLQTKNYPEAIKSLTEAIPVTKKRMKRARYMFILAQLYQLDGDYQKASELYGKVIKMNPPYDMAFNAQINRARCYDVGGKGGKEIKKQLLKMAKDEKNKDYLDQIYYALAGLALREDDEKTAIDYLKLSVQSSTSNGNQKALSFLELAQIYFKRPDYKAAQMYYDSTVTFLSKDHPDYENILAKKNILNKLVKNLNIIAFEDSVQQLAKMSSKERDAVIDDIIEKAVEAAEKKKQEEAEQKGQADAIFNQSNTAYNNTTMNAGPGWYFYNPTALSMGYSEFLKKWGNRKLEDNWRRSSKEVYAGGDDTEKDNDDDKDKTTKDSTTANIKDKQRYLKNIPLTAKQMEQSNQKIVDAYYTIAAIYREQLDDKKESVRTLEELLKRFPENKYQLPSYYQLYRLYSDLGNQEKSEYYKNLLLNKYPDSEYSMLIKNPNYFREHLSAKERLYVYYEETYQHFQNGQCEQVFSRKAIADTTFPNNELTPKFAYLKALCTGKTKGIDSLELALKNIVRDFPADTIRFKAKEVLDLIASQKTKSSPDTAKPKQQDTTAAVETEQKKTFILQSDTIHWYVIAFENDLFDTGKLKTKFSDYNRKYFSTSTYSVETLPFGSETQTVVVKAFENKTKAMEYYKSIEANEDYFKDTPIDVCQPFVISTGNFSRLFQEKNMETYLNFFQENYFK